MTAPGGLWYWSRVAWNGDASGLALCISLPPASGDPSRRIRSSSSIVVADRFFRNLQATIASPPIKIAPPTPTTTPMMVFLLRDESVELPPSLLSWAWPAAVVVVVLSGEATTVGVSTVVLVDVLVMTTSPLVLKMVVATLFVVGDGVTLGVVAVLAIFEFVVSVAVLVAGVGSVDVSAGVKVSASLVVEAVSDGCASVLAGPAELVVDSELLEEGVATSLVVVSVGVWDVVSGVVELSARKTKASLVWFSKSSMSPLDFPRNVENSNTTAAKKNKARVIFVPSVRTCA